MHTAQFVCVWWCGGGAPESKVRRYVAAGVGPSLCLLLPLGSACGLPALQRLRMNNRHTHPPTHPPLLLPATAPQVHALPAGV